MGGEKRVGKVRKKKLGKVGRQGLGGERSRVGLAERKGLGGRGEKGKVGGEKEVWWGEGGWEKEVGKVGQE